MKDPAKKLKESLVKPKTTPRTEYLSTGSTLLNLACSGRTSGGFRKGTYNLLVGDSSSGKSFISLTCFAEAAIHPAFQDYRLIFDDGENGSLMDREKYFGQAASRIEPPAMKDGEPYNSTTVEELYFHIDDALKVGKPFIYVLDSMDSLTSEDEVGQFKKEKAAKGKAVSGSYGTSKAKSNSSNLRVVVAGLEKTGSILILISQTRDNIGFGAQFNPKTRSGGKAMRFYATLELWTSIKEKLTKSVKEKDRKIGIIAEIRVKKNRLQGREPVVMVPILDRTGIDDTGGCVDFLVEEKHWPEAKGMIDAHDLEIKGRRETIIQKIESENRESELRNIVASVWLEIDEACALERKKRY